MDFECQKTPPGPPTEIFRRNFWSLPIGPEMAGSGFKSADYAQTASNFHQNTS